MMVTYVTDNYSAKELKKAYINNKREWDKAEAGKFPRVSMNKKALYAKAICNIRKENPRWEKDTHGKTAHISTRFK